MSTRFPPVHPEATPGVPSYYNCALLRATLRDYDTPDFVTLPLLGGRKTVPTLATVARAFNVSLATAKAWASVWWEGLSERPYNLLGILAWRIFEDQRNDQRQPFERSAEAPRF